MYWHYNIFVSPTNRCIWLLNYAVCMMYKRRQEGLHAEETYHMIHSTSSNSPISKMYVYPGFEAFPGMLL